MDTFGAALGARLASPAARIGAAAQEAYRPPSARLPQLGQAVATRSLALPMFQPLPTTGSRSLGSTLGRGLNNQYGMQLPDDGLSMFGRLAGQAYGSGFDAIASMLGLQTGNALGGQFGTTGAPFSPTGPRFASGRLDAAAGEINSAAAKYGVPANFLATIIAKESSGDWNRWARTAYHRGQPIMGYIGVYEDAARTRGLGDLWNRAHGNRGLQIELLAGVLRSQYDQLQQRYPGQMDWLNVASYHYSGNPFGGAAPADSTQHGSSDFYRSDTARLWGILEPGFNPKGAGSMGAALGGNLGGGSGWGGSDAIRTMLGGQNPRITQEIGPTAFSLGAGAWMYGYASSLGMKGHPGLDIGLNPGTPLYSPVAGTVITAGGSGYYRDDRYGNRAGTGELRIKLDNGDEVILGHMESIGVRVGQRVNAGLMVGRSGTANGGHVHLEYRQYTPGATSSGYTARDPREIFGGGMGMGAPGGFGQQQAPDYSMFGSNMADAARLVWDAGLRSQLLAR